MDSRSSDKNTEAGRLTPETEDAAFGELADVLKGLNEGRREAFFSWLEDENEEDGDNERRSGQVE